LLNGYFISRLLHFQFLKRLKFSRVLNLRRLEKNISMKKNLLKLAFLPAVLITVFVSCSKDPLKDMTNEESQIFITNYDTTVNFSNYKTFSIADSVAIVSNRNGVTKERTDGDAQFIEAVASALQARGFVRVSHNQNPDLGVTVSVISNTYSQVVSYSDYGYYDSYWDPFYWGYGGYNYYFPTYYGVYNINEQEIAIDIVDLKNAKQNNQLRSVWSGLIRGSGIFDTNAIANQVTQLLNQSPYLKSL